METLTTPLVQHTSHATTTPQKRAVFEIISNKKPGDFAKVFVPMVSINPHYLAFYEIPAEGRRPRTAAQLEAQRFLRENKPEGEISKKANGRINQCITWFTSLAKKKTKRMDNLTIDYKLTFVTLTLPSKQVHTDEYIKRNLLNRFLIEAKREWNMKNYFWRAEAQENGNIHFHILIDTFIHWRELRTRWNSICGDHGYIDQYRENMKQFFKDGFKCFPGDVRHEEQQYEAYQKNVACNFSDPNSTDVHKLKYVKNIARYVGKYCAKNIRYFEVKSNDTNRTIGELKKIREVFDVKLKNGVITFCTTKTEENRNIPAVEFLQMNNVYFSLAREKKIRDISGRLWYASDTVLSLKNVCIEISSEVSEALQYLTNAARGKWIQVSDYCRLFCTNLFDAVFDEDKISGLFKKLLPDIDEKLQTLCI